MLGLQRNARGAHAQLDARLRLRLVLSLARAAGRVDRLFRIPGPDARRPGVRLALLSYLAKARSVVTAPTLYGPRGQTFSLRTAPGSRRRSSRRLTRASDRCGPVAGGGCLREWLRDRAGAARLRGSRRCVRHVPAARGMR